MITNLYTVNRAFNFSGIAQTETLPPFMVNGDNRAHKFSITCLDGSVAADLSGLQCACIVVNGRNKTVEFAGAISENTVTVLMEEDCYRVSGPLDIMIKLVGTDFSVTIYRAKTYVLTGASDEAYDPTGRISLEGLITLRGELDQAMADIESIFNWENRLSLSVLKFGADPLGTKDSGAAINAAIAYAVANGYASAYAPAGCYIIETPIDNKSNIRIYGDKKNSIFKIKPGADINCFESSAEVHYASIEDIAIDGSADVNTYVNGGRAIKIWINQSRIKNVFAYNLAGAALELNCEDGVSTNLGYRNIVKNCVFDGCDGTAIKWGKYIRDSWLAYSSATADDVCLSVAGTSCNFIGNRFSGGNYNLHLNAANNHIFLGNLLELAQKHAVYAMPATTDDVCYSCLFANNVMRNCSAGGNGMYDVIHLEGHADLAMRNVLITGNMLVTNQAVKPRYPIYLKYGDNLTVDANLYDGYTETLPVYEDSVYNSAIRFRKSKDEYVNVVDHGADKYGVNDSGAAINAAIEYAATHGYEKVYIPSGLYLMETPMVPKNNLIIFGDGKASILKPKTGADINCVEPTAEVHYAKLESFAVDGNASGNTYVNGGSALKVWLHTSILREIYTYNIAKHALELNSDDSISANTGYLNVVDHCHFWESKEEAVYWGWRSTDSWMEFTNIGSVKANLLLEGNTGRFIGNHFDGEAEYNIHVKNGANHMLFSNNVIENAGKHGIYFQQPEYETTYSNISIVGNIIRSCSRDAVGTYDLIHIEGYSETAKAANILISGNQLVNTNNSNVTLPRYLIFLKNCDNAQVAANVYDEDGCSADLPIYTENVTGEIKDQMTYRGEVKPQQEINDRIADELNHLAHGRDLSGLFASFAAVMEKVGDGTFAGIRVCDYWDASLSGTYRDYSLESCPSGITYYSDTSLTTSVGVTTETVDAAYIDVTYCSIVIGGTTYYVATGDCNGYRERSVSGATFRGQFAALQPYGRSINKNHSIICGFATFPNRSAMRKASDLWEASGEITPWLGSALKRTLCDPDYGIIRLFDGTVFADYIYAGSGGDGMTFPMERKPAGAWSADNCVTDERGILFIPIEHEVFGCSVRSSAAYGLGYVRQWELFRDCHDTVAKMEGDTSSYNAYWLASAQEGTPTQFCAVSVDGRPIAAGDNADWYSFPICFVVAEPEVES